VNYTHIALVGAFDRHNYGDLLFPLVIETFLKQHQSNKPIEFFSITNSNMEIYGGKNTKSIDQLFTKKRKTRDLIVIAGGEVLPAKWSLMLSYLLPPIQAKILNRLASVIGEKFASQIISSFFRAGSSLPFVYSPNDFSRKVCISYNAVGGSHIKDETEFIKGTLIQKLKEATYISVRDNETKHFLEKSGVKNIKLSPDCAILLSKMYPLHSLRKSVSKETLEITNRFPNGYICFQSALPHTKGHERQILDAIQGIIGKTNVGVIVIAIGRATGHEDHKVFELFPRELMADSNAKLACARSSSITDLIWLIANSRIYAGTSLHGAITAASYGVPIVGLCPKKVNKLPAFLSTWASEHSYKLCEYSELQYSCESTLESKVSIVDRKIAVAQELAHQNLERLFSI
jgi:hypothetical protein